MIDIAVVGDAATEKWVARKEQKLGSEGLRCSFVDWKTDPGSVPEADLWLVDLGCLASHEVESLNTIGALNGESSPRPWVAMANTFSLELTQAVLSLGAARCLSKPVTPRALLECCRELGVGEPPRSGMLAVMEDRDSAYQSLDTALTGAGLAVERLVDVQSGVVALQKDPPDGLVVSHYPESLSIRAVIDLLRRFPQLNTVPVFIIKGKARQGEVLQALNALVDVVYVAGVDELTDAVTSRLKRSLPAHGARHRLYEKFHDYEQEQRALHLHAIVSKTDRAGRIIEVNPRFCEVSGYSEEELIGQNHRILKSDHHSAEFYRELWSTISQGEVWRGEICNRARDGSFYWVSSTIVPCLDQSGRPYQYIAIRKDITHVKGAESLISQQSGLASCLGELGARLLDVGWQDAVHGLRSALAPLCYLLQAEGIALDLQRHYPFLHYLTKASPVVEELPALWIRNAETEHGDPGSGGISSFEAPLMVKNVQLGTVSLLGPYSPMGETFSQRGLIELFANILAGALTRWQREFENDQSRERLRIAQK